MIIPGLQAAVAELADALDSKSSGSNRAGSSPASGISKNPESIENPVFLILSGFLFLYQKYVTV